MQSLEIDEQQSDIRQQNQISVFASGLERKAEEQARLRVEIEQRWIEDLRQYHGKYDPATEARLKNKESKLFVNITRNKTNSGEARAMDMLFPVDDRNWSIAPTPVPDLVNAAKDLTPVQFPDGTQPQINGQTVTKGDLARRQMDIAKERAKAMQDEIDDQLVEAKYNQKCRDILHHAALYGTGILKGPVVVGKTERAWQRMDTPQGSVHIMIAKEIKVPTVDVVNPWNFFPDMSARCVDEAEFFFELHPMTKAEVRRLAKNPGFNADEIRALLREEPRENIVYSRAYEIKEISGITGVSWDNRYHIWEYSGPVSKADLEAAGARLPENIIDDPLIEFDAVIWFCQGHVLKAALNPMDTEDKPYSVMNWEKDDNCIFGYGIPYLGRSPQKVINASWRMILDNAGLSTGPQIIFNKALIQPLDGVWELKPRKLWYADQQNIDLRQAFVTFEISSHQQELAAIFESARQLMDEETNLPLIAQGEQTGNYTHTMGGMSMLMNNANIVLKRVIKNWDDDITQTFISRMYNWNMQFNDNEDIKGDYNVYTRGTGALLVREVQAQNLMQLMQIATSPLFAPFTKLPDLFRKAVQLLQIPESDVIKSDDQIQAEQQQAAQQPQQQPPDVMKAQMQMQMQQMDLQAQAEELKVKMIELDTKKELELAKMAVDKQMNVEQLRTQLGLKAAEIQNKRDMMELDAAVKAKFGTGL